MSVLSDDFPMSMEREAGMPEQVPPIAVSFGMYPLRDKKQSDAAGRDIYRDVEFVKIAVPGDKHSVVFQPATGVHRKRFPNAYRAFKERDHTPIEGTILEHWPIASRSIVLNLKALHVHTVEALAAVHDGNIDRLGANARELREKARAWLEEAKSGAATARLAAEKEALQGQLAAMHEQLKALQQRFDEESKDDEEGGEAPRRRGRPPRPQQQSQPLS